MAVLTYTEYNAYAGTSGIDSLVTSLISRAQAFAEKHCDVGSFDEATYTDAVYDGSGTDQIRLRNIPVTAVTAVKIRTGLADATLETQATNTYLFETDRSGLLTRLTNTPVWPGESVPVNGAVSLTPLAVWPAGRQNIVVTYTAGYDASTMPADLKHAICRMVDAYRGRIGLGGFQSESMGAYSYTLPSGADWAAITPEVAGLLAPYRRVA